MRLRSCWLVPAFLAWTSLPAGASQLDYATYRLPDLLHVSFEHRSELHDDDARGLRGRLDGNRNWTLDEDEVYEHELGHQGWMERHMQEDLRLDGAPYRSGEATVTSEGLRHVDVNSTQAILLTAFVEATLREEPAAEEHRFSVNGSYAAETRINIRIPSGFHLSAAEGLVVKDACEATGVLDRGEFATVRFARAAGKCPVESKAALPGPSMAMVALAAGLGWAWRRPPETV